MGNTGDITNLYLDIDDVLNLGINARNPWPITETHSLTIEFPPELIAQLNDILASNPQVRPVWLTSWEHEAADFGRAVGLIGSETWEYLPGTGPGRDAEWEKFESIQAHVAATQPSRVIWCDNEINDNPVAARWAESIGALALVPSVVLTQEHLDSLRDFLAR